MIAPKEIVWYPERPQKCSLTDLIRISTIPSKDELYKTEGCAQSGKVSLRTMWQLKRTVDLLGDSNSNISGPAGENN